MVRIRGRIVRSVIFYEKDVQLPGNKIQINKSAVSDNFPAEIVQRKTLIHPELLRNMMPLAK